MHTIFHDTVVLTVVACVATNEHHESEHALCAMHHTTDVRPGWLAGTHRVPVCLALLVHGELGEVPAAGALAADPPVIPEGAIHNPHGVGCIHAQCSLGSGTGIL